MEDVRACLGGQTPTQLPVFLLSGPFDARVLGIPYERYATDADTMVTCHASAIARFDYDWAFLHVDSCAVLEPLGIVSGPVFGGLGQAPWTPASHLPACDETLRRLKVPDPLREGRMPKILEAIGCLKRMYGDTICVCGHTTAPFTSLSYLFGVEAALMLLYDDPGLAHAAIQLMLEVQVRFGEAQLAAGADAIWVSDLNATSHMISEAHLCRFALEPARRMVCAYRRRGGLVFLHHNEVHLPYILAHASLAIDGGVALNVGQRADIAQVQSALGGRLCLMGNLDPLSLARARDLARLEAEVVALLHTACGSRGYIFNSGGQIAVVTPEENVHRVIEAARTHWRRL
jgi:uroporphyrinogen decarboxylase